MENMFVSLGGTESANQIFLSCVKLLVIIIF